METQTIEFKSGDLVRLTSGSPDLTVICFAPNVEQYCVAWWKNGPQRDFFPAECLVLADKAPQRSTGPRPVQISGRDELRLALQIWQQDPGTCRADQNLAQDLLQLIEDGDTGDCGLNPRRSKQLANLMQEHDSCLTAMGQSVFPQLDYFFTELKSILIPIYQSKIPSSTSSEADPTPQGAEP